MHPISEETGCYVFVNAQNSRNGYWKYCNATDPLTGQPITADDLYMDWVVTNYLLDENVADGRYIYHNYANASQTFATEFVSDCPTGQMGRAVKQNMVWITFRSTAQGTTPCASRPRR